MTCLATVQEEDRAIEHALRILRSRLRTRPVVSNRTVHDFLRLHSQGLDHEVFAVMYLDAQHCFIEYARMFRGTLTYTPVVPREVARHALAANAAAVILHHNHPSDTCRPSNDDIALTQRLSAALELVEVRVLDHVITSDAGCFSMAESGLLP